jgi:hypothetical protein
MCNTEWPGSAGLCYEPVAADSDAVLIRRLQGIGISIADTASAEAETYS